MLGSKGQQWEVMKLLQGGVIAMLMFMVVYGVVTSVRGQIPQSDVYSVTCEILGSAYAARGTGEYFVRDAMLVEQGFDTMALVQCSGLPSASTVNLYCKQAYCIYDGEPLNRGSKCRLHSPCSQIDLEAGQTIKVCSACDADECRVWFGESEC